MPDTAVDTNILVDVLVDDPDHGAASARALDEAARQGALVVGPATVAELATLFARRGKDAGTAVRTFLADAGIRATPLRDEDAPAAGHAFALHLAKRPAGVACSACGQTTAACNKCGNELRIRDRIATDFLILAHARAAGRLLTRDRGLRMAGVQIVRP